MTNTEQSTGENNLSVNEINLPKGGGAIEGIGENFEANTFNGSVGLSLPIAVSPCLSITPDLSINCTGNFDYRNG